MVWQKETTEAHCYWWQLSRQWLWCSQPK